MLDYNYTYTLTKRRSDDKLQEDQRNVQFLQVAAEGQTPRIRYLLSLGADLDFRDQYGLTALHHAVVSGFEEAVELLLQLGAEVDASSAGFGTPLSIAVLRGRVNLIDLLLNFEPSRRYISVASEQLCIALRGREMSTS